MSRQVLSPEDQARADFYGLLARLFFDAPDAELLRSLSAAADLPAESQDFALPASWKELKRAAAAADPQAVREEYESVFIGTGKAEITPYASAYLLKSGAWSGSRPPLVVLRDFLVEHGLARKEGVHEPEDHVAALCEVMRHLVVEDKGQAQRDFYKNFLAPAGSGLCAAIASSTRARFYQPVARFAAAFLDLEQEFSK